MGELDESVQDDAPVAVAAAEEPPAQDPGADEVEALEMGTSGADEEAVAPAKPKRAPAKRTASKTTKITRKREAD
jgi:hypothetical protein